MYKLVETGNKLITHTKDNGKYKIEFPRALMNVRRSLSNDLNSSNNSPASAIL